MSSDLDIFKQIKMNENINIYNKNVQNLYSSLVINITRVQYSRQTIKAKQNQINTLKNQYNINVNNLKSNLDKSILGIQNFIPKSIIINKNKKALLIGINYTGTSNELYGCINDVNSIKERLDVQGFKDINILTDLTTKKATRDNILAEFKKFLTNAQTGDLLFVSYSGHGSNTYDRNGDEKDGIDEMIVTSDLKPILDDELKSIIQKFLKPNVTLFALFDSCFSGSVLDLKYQYMDSHNYDNYTENSKQIETQGNVLLISGCTDEQTSDDAVFNNKPNGAMTWSLLECLKQNPNCNWRELVKSMRDLLKTSKFTQIPQFSSGNFVDIDTKIFI